MLFKGSQFAESQGFDGKPASLRCCLLAEASRSCQLPAENPKGAACCLSPLPGGHRSPVPASSWFPPCLQLSSSPQSRAAFAKTFPKGWQTEQGSRTRRRRTSSTFPSPSPAAGRAGLSCALLAAGSVASPSRCVLARQQQRSQLGCLLPRRAACVGLLSKTWQGAQGLGSTKPISAAAPSAEAVLGQRPPRAASVSPLQSSSFRQLPAPRAGVLQTLLRGSRALLLFSP